MKNLIQEIEKAKFTKGEWITYETDNCFCISTSYYDGIATTTFREEDKANAHLIAASPALLEVVKLLLQYQEYRYGEGEPIDMRLIFEKAEIVARKALGI